MEIGLPDDIEHARQLLNDSMSWQNFDHQNFVDDLLQEIAGKTNIVVQYLPEGYRATYNCAKLQTQGEASHINDGISDLVIEHHGETAVMSPAIVKKIEINLHGQTPEDIQRVLQMAIQEISQSMSGGAGGGRDCGYAFGID